MQQLRSATGFVDDQVLVRVADLPTPPAAAFDLFVLPCRLESWLCRRALVDAQLGAGITPAAPRIINIGGRDHTADGEPVMGRPDLID